MAAQEEKRRALHKNSLRTAHAVQASRKSAYQRDAVDKNRQAAHTSLKDRSTDTAAVKAAVPEDGQSLREKKDQYKKSRAAELRRCIGKIACACTVFLLLYAILLGNIKVNELNEESLKTKKQIEQLQSDEKKLSVELERKTDLRQIENIAVNQLGMVKLEKSQVTYVDLKNPDKVEIIGKSTDTEQQNKDSRGLINSIVKTLSVIVEYLN